MQKLRLLINKYSSSLATWSVRAVFRAPHASILVHIHSTAHSLPSYEREVLASRHR